MKKQIIILNGINLSEREPIDILIKNIDLSNPLWKGWNSSNKKR